MELTLHRQKTPFSYFNVSGTQTSTKSPGNLRASIFGRKTCGRRKRTSGGPRPKRGWPTRPGTVAAWGPPVWPSWLRCRRSFIHRLRFDLKTSIKKAPRRSLEGAPHKHRNTETELQIGGGKLRRGVAGVVSIFSIDFSTVSTEEGVVHLWTMEGKNSGGALPVWFSSSPSTSPPSP